MPKIKRRQHKKKCPFCESQSQPHYRDVDMLSNFISERKRILPAIYTGACAKHQRSLSLAIKQSRYLALLPYTAGL